MFLDGPKNYENDDENESDNGSTGIDYHLFWKFERGVKLICMVFVQDAS